MLDTLYLRTLLVMNARELGALRFSAILQALFMLLNNLVFFAFWFILYTNVDSIRGMKIEDMAFLYATTAGAFGFAVVLFGGCLNQAETVANGILDIYLTQPRDPHFQVLTSKVHISGLGDLLSGFVFIGYYFGSHPAVWGLWLLSSLIGAAIFVGSISIFQSIIFWVARTENLSGQLFEFLLSFALYPPSIFPGPVRALTYTLLPGAFIGFLPMVARRDHSFGMLFASLGAAVFYLWLSRLIFKKGLENYASGSMNAVVR